MNKGLYKHVNRKYIYWYETWKNSSKNSGSTLAIWKYDTQPNFWSWSNCNEDDEEDNGQLIGSSCLARW